MIIIKGGKLKTQFFFMVKTQDHRNSSRSFFISVNQKTSPGARIRHTAQAMFIYPPEPDNYKYMITVTCISIRRPDTKSRANYGESVLKDSPFCQKMGCFKWWLGEIFQNVGLCARKLWSFRTCGF